ncbi:hypothetical protein PC128_g4876 [Phytophthora cactorum]|nr:hypothetical protein PC128_g4876 [Phytophthora cactorum]
MPMQQRRACQERSDASNRLLSSRLAGESLLHPHARLSKLLLLLPMADFEAPGQRHSVAAAGVFGQVLCCCPAQAA